MTKLKKGFKQLKETALENAVVSFYVVKRKMTARTAAYSVFHVDVDKKLQDRLRSAAVRKITNSNNVREYEFSTTDLDDEVLGIETSETDMQQIIIGISSDEKTRQATKVEDLYDAWMYISCLDIENLPPLYFARQISGAWNIKKISSLSSLIWKDQILMDVSEDKLFKIDTKIDFFSFDGLLFIADKKNFETALNFRLGMEKARDAIIEEFKQQKTVADVATFADLIGNNVRWLRKLSQVKKAGYYRDPKYLAGLRDINQKESWGLRYNNDGQIIVNEQNIDDVLRYLNNDRLSSKINSETFVVDAKHKL